MNWIFKLIEPLIKECETPEEAENKVKEWGQTVHPRDYFCGLIAIWTINANWEHYQKIKNYSLMTQSQQTVEQKWEDWFFEYITQVIFSETPSNAALLISSAVEVQLKRIANRQEQQLPAGTIAFIPIEIKEGCELPEKTDMYFVINRHGAKYSAMYSPSELRDDHFRSYFSHWLKETTIPNIAELSRQIEVLQDQVIKEQEESKRLKELIERRERMWFGKFTESANPIVVDNHWNDFKRSNNI